VQETRLGPADHLRDVNLSLMYDGFMHLYDEQKASLMYNVMWKASEYGRKSVS